MKIYKGHGLMIPAEHTHYQVDLTGTPDQVRLSRLLDSMCVLIRQT
jgi:hypothetical protein